MSSPTTVFLKKAWVWIKTHWYLPILLIALVCVWLTGRARTQKIIKMFELSKASYELQIKTINDNHEKELKKRSELQLKYIETMEKIEKENKDAFSGLSEKKKKEIDKLVKEYEGKPDDLARDLSEMFGVEYVE